MLKTSSSSTEKWDGFLRVPNADQKRAKFSIQVRSKKNGVTSYVTLQSETLDLVNRDFKAGIIPFERAKILAKDILDQLRPKSAITHNSENLELLKQYWKEEYEDRDLIAPDVAYWRLERAVEAVGIRSLRTASKKELQEEVDSRFQGNKQRALIGALNQILKYLGRKERLRKAREVINSVAYVTEAEFQSILTFIIDPKIKLLYQVAFGTGMRLGEIFAISPERFKEKLVDVSTQIDDSHKQRELKNRKVHKAWIIPDYRKAVKDWSEVTDKLSIRDLDYARLTRQLSRKALGKEINFYALRHSYAIYCLAHNQSISLISKSMGNSILVCEKYYSGYSLTTESIELMDSLFKDFKHLK